MCVCVCVCVCVCIRVREILYILESECIVFSLWGFGGGCWFFFFCLFHRLKKTPVFSIWLNCSYQYFLFPGLLCNPAFMAHKTIPFTSKRDVQIDSFGGSHLNNSHNLKELRPNVANVSQYRLICLS